MERTIQIKMSNEECERLIDLCGQNDLNIEELFENFVADLICGTNTNGSDERDCIHRWFERCGFGRYSKSLLQFLFDSWYTDVWDFVDTLDNISSGYELLPDMDDKEEMEYLREDLKNWDEDIAVIKKEYLNEVPSADWDKEVAAVREWCEKSRKFYGV